MNREEYVKEPTGELERWWRETIVEDVTQAVSGWGKEIKK